MIKAPQGGQQRKYVEQPNIAPGSYPGRIVQLIDLGLQPQRPYQGQDKKPAYELMFTYELVDTFVVDEQGKELENKPRWISETLPLHPLIADKAKSTQRYNTIDPNGEFGGDFSKLIDKPVSVLVVNNKSNGKVYDNVASIAAMRPRDAANCPELVNKPTIFSLEDPDIDVFNRLPKWIQDKIRGNLNFNGSKLQMLVGGNQPAPAPKPVPEEANAELPDDDLPY